MNKKDKVTNQKKTWYRYHIPGMTNLHRLKINAVFLSAANSERHEMAKAKKCYEILKEGHKFITEAQRNAKDKNGKIRRADVVDLDTGIEYEIETDPRRAKRFDGENGVVVIKLWEE